MTNFERYRDEILKIVESSAYCQVAIKDGKPVLCEETVCAGCELDKEDRSGCVLNFMKWGYEDDDADCSPDAGKPKVDPKGCSSCKYRDKALYEDPCSECSRRYTDKFELKPKKTRQDEFLRRYPDAKKDGAGFIFIKPCSIDMKLCGSEICKRNNNCKECVESYWSQEVE